MGVVRRQNPKVERWFGQESMDRALGTFQRMHQALTSPREGYTVNVRTGREPTTGWMVSEKGAEHQMKLPGSPADIQRYHHEHSAALQHAGYSGGWAPTGEGRAYLDASRRYAGTTRGLLQAGAAMERHEQRSMYNLGTGQTYTSTASRRKIGPGRAPPPGSTRSLAAFQSTPEAAENRQIHQAWATQRLRERGIELP